jgi:lipopolysaccharide export system ATP-binding protein
MPLLEANGLVKSYATRRVVDGVSFSVERAEIVGLLGPNGAGKTTSFRMTCGMVEPDQGQVLLDGQDVTSWPMYRRAKAGMGYLAQEASVFKKLTVEQNLLGVMELLGKDWKTRKRVSDDLLDQFKITHIRHSKAGNISGGERRRLEIARCLVSDPEIILLDEPFTGIDPKTIESIQDIIRELRSRGISILITDHQVRETLDITDRSYVIHKGTVLCHGTRREVLNHPEARERYFGNNIDAGSSGPPAPHMRTDDDEPTDDIPVKRPRRRNIHEDETLDAE